MSKKASHNIVAYNKVDLGRIQFTELNESDRIPSQKIAYVSYDDPKKGSNQFDIQTPEILLDNYGIPDGDGPFYPTVDRSCMLEAMQELDAHLDAVNENSKSFTGGTGGAATGKSGGNTNTNETSAEKKDSVDGSVDASADLTNAPTVDQTTGNTADQRNKAENEQSTEQGIEASASAGAGAGSGGGSSWIWILLLILLLGGGGLAIFSSQEE